MKEMIISKQYIYILCFLAVCSSCRKHKGVYFQDFENLIAWNDVYKDLDAERAHRGKYSSKIGAGRAYSYGFEIPLKEAKQKGYARMHAHAFVMISEKKCNAKLVMSVEGNGKLLEWNSRTFNEFAGTPYRWEEISGVMLIPPDDTTADYKVKVYAWSEDGKTAWIDDVRIFFR